MKHNVNENTYSFNFKKFKIFKKRLKSFLKEKYGDNFYAVSRWQDKEFKEAFYKHILWFSWQTDVFNSWRKKDIWEFELDSDTKEIISMTKKHIKEILYKK